MTPGELAIILIWVLFPPWVLGAAVLVTLHRKRRRRSFCRTIEATGLLCSVSFALALAMLVTTPPGFGRLVGLRDEPVMWAPFAFIAVALVLPLAIWWASRARR